jgi:hypothetical protein
MYWPTPLEYSIPSMGEEAVRSITRGRDLSHTAQALDLSCLKAAIQTESPTISDIRQVAITPISFVTYGTLSRKIGYVAYEAVLVFQH